MKKILMSLLVTSGINCMSLERIYPQESVRKLLKEFHKPTGSTYNHPKPDMQKFQQQGRCFIAKMSSYGLDRYFLVKTNEDVDALVKAVQQGQSMTVKWLFYDVAKDILTAQQIKPGVVLLADDLSD